MSDAGHKDRAWRKYNGSGRWPEPTLLQAGAAPDRNMSYAVKDIFLTLQGEGYHSGRTAVFVRFSGCNLWSGREPDRHKGPSCSRWCDTNFLGTEGPGGGRFSARELVQKVLSLWPDPSDPFVVCTGGEPHLQLDEPLLNEMHQAGCQVAVERMGRSPTRLVRAGSRSARRRIPGCCSTRGTS